MGWKCACASERVVRRGELGRRDGIDWKDAFCERDSDKSEAKCNKECPKGKGRCHKHKRGQGPAIETWKCGCGK